MWEGGAHKAPHSAVNVAGGEGQCLSSVAHGRLLQQMLPISILVRTALTGFSELFWGDRGWLGRKCVEGGVQEKLEAGRREVDII